MQMGMDNPAHNTLSAETQQVRIFHPFHPLRGLSVQVIRKPKRGDGAVTVVDPAGRRLKIPIWMVTPDWADVQIVSQPHLSKEALLGLTSLLAVTGRRPRLHELRHNAAFRIMPSPRRQAAGIAWLNCSDSA